MKKKEIFIPLSPLIFSYKNIKKFMFFEKGQEKYKIFSKLYLRGATGCIIVSDITRIETLKSALVWKQLVNKCFEEDEKPKIPMILFQNKADLKPKMDLEADGSEQILQEFGQDENFIGLVQTSAKENQNLKEGIAMLVEEITRRRENKGKTCELWEWRSIEMAGQVLSNDRNQNQERKACC